MAEVFKAKSYGVEGFEKIIAIKRILPSMGEDRDFIKMFIDEAKIVGQLAHANICQIFELGRIEGTHFIAMEYIWGKDLLQIQNRLSKTGQAMHVPMACHIMSKVCEGLDYAHKKRDPMGGALEIVHRDCSPQNVLVSYEGEVKLIDFGIAKAASRSSRTMAGVLKGKFGYMSPEQVRGLPLDRRSDIFSVGTVFYECLTGAKLFQGESDFSTLEKVRNVDVEPPRSINADIPPEVEAIVMKALEGDVDKRYQWCSEMQADLQKYLMTQDAVFTTKTLSAWMKEHFTAELNRERKLMEEYKKVGRDGQLSAPPPEAESVLEDAGSALEDAGSGDDDDAEPTVLGDMNFGNILAGKRGNGGSDFGDDAPTEIFGEVGDEAPGAVNPGMGPGARPPAPQDDDDDDGATIVAGDMGALPGVAAAGDEESANAPTVLDDSGLEALRDKVLGQQSGGGSPGGGPPGSGPPPTPPSGPASPGSGEVPQAPAQAPGMGGAFGSPPDMPSGGPGQGMGAPGQQPGQGMGAPGQQPGQGMGAPGQQPGQGMGQPGGPGQPGQPGPGMGQPGQPGPGMGQPGQPGPGMGQPGQPGPGMGQPGQPGAPGFMGYYQQQSPGQPYAQQQPYGSPEMFGSTSTVAQLGQSDPADKRKKRRATLGRDIGIGVGITAVVLGLALGAKLLFFGGEEKPETPSAPPKGTMIVTVNGDEPAEVLVDGKNAGTARGGKPLQVQVELGTHEVRVMRDSAKEPCEDKVELADVNVEKLVECELEAKEPPKGTLVLEGIPEGHEVLVDGEALAEGATSRPIELTAGEPHEVVVQSDGEVVSEMSVTVAAGEEERRAVEIEDKEDDKVSSRDDGDDEAPNRPRRRDHRPRDRTPDRTDSGENEGEDEGEIGYLMADTQPYAKVYVDGQDTGRTTPIGPRRRIPLKPGKHRVTFVVGKEKYHRTVVIKPGKLTRMKETLE